MSCTIQTVQVAGKKDGKNGWTNIVDALGRKFAYGPSSEKYPRNWTMEVGCTYKCKVGEPNEYQSSLVFSAEKIFESMPSVPEPSNAPVRIHEPKTAQQVKTDYEAGQAWGNSMHCASRIISAMIDTSYINFKGLDNPEEKIVYIAEMTTKLAETMLNRRTEK